MQAGETKRKGSMGRNERHAKHVSYVFLFFGEGRNEVLQCSITENKPLSGRKVKNKGGGEKAKKIREEGEK